MIFFVLFPFAKINKAELSKRPNWKSLPDFISVLLFHIQNVPFTCRCFSFHQGSYHWMLAKAGCSLKFGALYVRTFCP